MTIDIGQWANNSDDTTPISVEGTGEPYHDIRDTLTTYEIEYRYANGVRMSLMDLVTARKRHFQFQFGESVRGVSVGLILMGSEGWIWVSRVGMRTEPASLIKTVLGPNDVHVYRSDDHPQNLLDAIRTGQPTVSPVEVGVHDEMICQMGDIAVRMGRSCNGTRSKRSSSAMRPRTASSTASCGARGGSKFRAPSAPREHSVRAATLLVLFGAAAVVAGAGRPGAGGPQRPAISSSVRLEDWALFRSAANGVLGWRVGVATQVYSRLTFSEAAARVDALGVANIAGSGTQKLSKEIFKNLDPNLTANELAALRDRLLALNLRMPAYYAASMGPDEASLRKLFEFSKGLGVDTIIGSPQADSLTTVAKLADEFGINVALDDRAPAYSDLARLSRALEGRSNRIGAAIDALRPLDGLRALRERVLTVNLHGAAGSAEFLMEMYRAGVKPSFISLNPSGGGDPQAELARSFEEFDKALHPVMTDRVNEMARTAAIRKPDTIAAEDRQRIEAALPQRAPGRPEETQEAARRGSERGIPRPSLDTARQSCDRAHGQEDRRIRGGVQQ